jgi:hypothetical protein
MGIVLLLVPDGASPVPGVGVGWPNPVNIIQALDCGVHAGWPLGLLPRLPPTLLPRLPPGLLPGLTPGVPPVPPVTGLGLTGMTAMTIVEVTTGPSEGAPPPE